MSTDTKGELAAFLKSYDSDGSGTFNRDRWLHLCSSSAINLPQNLATAVFDRLDTDHNGIVTINELLAELEEWQKTVEHAKDNGVGEMCKPLNPTEFTDPVPANSQGLINGTSRGPIRPQGTLTFKKREYSVYESSPEEINSAFRQSLYQAKKLGDFIRESYPELAQPFSNMLDSFKKDINIERSEHQTLEQISRQLEAEYQEKIYKKEAEIQNIQEIVSDLKQKLKENDKKRSASVAHHHKLPQSPLTTDNAVFSAASSDTLAREEIDLRKALREAQIRLKASETELSQLQTKVETQSSELVMERMRSSNYAEEKDLLYDQVNKMKYAGTLLSDSGQWSGMNDVPFLDARDLMALSNQVNFSFPLLKKNSRGAKQESLISGWSNVDASQTPERIFRIILVGDSAVGKTSFMHRFCTGDFYQNTRSTIGNSGHTFPSKLTRKKRGLKFCLCVDFKARNIFIDGILCTIELWDTAGQERQEHSGDEMIPRVIVGNKSDLRDKTEEAMTSMAEYVTTEMGQNLAKLYHAEFVETSVLKNTHIEDAVVNLSRLMKIREDYTQNAIKLSKSKKKFQDCCH
ncbi:unnamed protein product [Schistocephalus solidus]|uniref:EF-hand domain-containing protein n=1 Tax=Schistocephalus solidus TaxID=70667 RepID=A0A183SIG5_SCHSO|nr:unnamed protein product [Schistocephalus solidus]